MPQRRQELGDRAALRRLDADGLAAWMAARRGRCTPAEALRVLRHPFVTTELVDDVAIDRRLTAALAVRRAVARHPRAAPTTAMRFVPGLFWRDLVEITLDVRLSPAVRRAAERYLLMRLPTMAIGERIAAARRCTGLALAHLQDDPEPRVLAAALDNPRLSEGMLLRRISDPRVHPRLLDVVARNDRWSTRYAIRLALGRNPQTPFQVQWRILPGLRRADLAAIADDPRHSSVVRRRAEELGSPGPNA